MMEDEINITNEDSLHELESDLGDELSMDENEFNDDHLDLDPLDSKFDE